MKLLRMESLLPSTSQKKKTKNKTKAQSREMDVSGHLMASRRGGFSHRCQGLAQDFPSAL